MKGLFAQTFIAAAFSLATLAHGINAQEVLDKRITLQAEDQPVKSVLAGIEKQASIKFMYAHEIIRANRRVSLTVANERLEDVLRKFLEPLRIRYEVSGERILLTAPAGSLGAATGTGDARAAFQVSGKVVDDKGVGIPGATVSLKGNTNATITDADGKYSLSIPDGTGTLVFSFIGFVSEEIPVNGQSVINVTLIADIKSLEEVVVVGYGTQQKKDVTGSIGSITSKDIKGVAVTGLDQALQGKVAGVQVTQNSGEPGGSVSIRIRGVGSINGASEPLYIVDGVPYGAGAMNFINPNDIERIDVLKDASATAIYGSRATNGVVIVTTRRAQAGKISVNIDAYAGVQSAYRKLDVLNGTQFATLANENIATANAEYQAAGLPDRLGINPAWTNPATVPNTDWQATVLQPAPIQSYNVTISGGNDKSRSLLALGYFDQSGITAPSNYKRYTVRLNTDYEISSKLRAGTTLNGSFDEKNSILSVDGGNTGFFGALTSSARMHPTALARTDQQGYYGLNPDGSFNSDSVYYGYKGFSFPSQFSGRAGSTSYLPAGLSNTAYLYQQSRTDVSRSQQIMAAGYLELEVVKGLKLRTDINYALSGNYGTFFQRASPLPIQNRGNNPTESQFFEGSGSNGQWNWVNTITYANKIGQHNFSALVGTDALRGRGRFTNVNAIKLPEDQQYVNASEFGSRSVFGNPNDYSLASYIGRLTYDFAGKYLFTANIRRDGSSNFGPRNKWGWFPSVSAGWRISDEEFMKNIPFVNELKLRASYGRVGNQGIPAFRYLNTYNNDGGRRSYTLGSGQAPVNAIFPTNLGDPNIRWESSTQTNIGLDVGLLDNRFTFTAEYYIKDINDMLGEFPVPSYMSVPRNSITRNGFAMVNKGLELAVGYNQQFGDIKFSASANFATLNNRVTRLIDNVTGFVTADISAGDADGKAITRTQVNDRIGGFYGFVTDGIIQNAADLASSGLDTKITAIGDRKYKDLDGDRQITSQDRQLIGNGLPRYTYGATVRADYKGFDLSVLINGQADVQVANQTRFWLYHMRYAPLQGGLTNVSPDLFNSWKGEGTSNELPRNSYNASPNNRYFSTFNIENGAFLRIRNVQLGYTLPRGIAQRMRASSARIYVAAQNLFTFTKYTGYDPEMGSLNQNVLQTGVDFGRYPVARMFMGGVNVQF